MCLGNISGDFSGNNMKETELNGCAYGFFADINIINIHKNLMKKQRKKIFGLNKNIFGLDWIINWFS